MLLLVLLEHFFLIGQLLFLLVNSLMIVIHDSMIIIGIIIIGIFILINHALIINFLDKLIE